MARKVNKKFLALFLGVVALIGVAGAILYLSVQKSPEDHIAMGEAALAEGRYRDAFDSYGKAANKRKGDAALVIKLGDILDAISSEDAENYHKARDYWRTALQVDPKNTVALERLFERTNDQVNTGGRPDAAAFQGLREAAQALLAVQPDHPAARRAIPVSYIQGWLSDVATDASQIDQAIVQLEEIYQQDPSDELALYFIARAKIRRAELAMRGGNSTQGQVLLNEVETLFEDAIAANPQDAGLHFRGAQTLTVLAAFSREANRRQEMFNRALARAEEARRLVKSDDELYVDVHTTVFALRRQQGDLQGAEDVLTELHKQRPSDRVVRLALADFLSAQPARRAEAITLLTTPLPQSGPIAGTRGVRELDLEYQEMILLADLRVGAYSATTDTKQREELEREITRTIDRLATRLGGETLAPLHLKGKFELAKGDNVAAVITLGRVINLVPAGTPQRVEVALLLAQAYLNTGQTGQAKIYLQEVINLNPGHLGARLQLAQLLVRENKLDEARPHVEVAHRALPNEPEVVRLVLATLDREKDKEKIDSLYHSLPEDSRIHRFQKAQLALALNRSDDAIRILRDALVENPADADAMTSLVRIHLALGQRDEALQMLDEAKQQFPDNEALAAVRAQIENPSPEQLENIRREMVEQIGDPVQRALVMYDLLRQQGKIEEAQQQLVAAEKQNPQHPQVLEHLFAQAVQRKDWDAAGKIVDRVAKANTDLAGGRIFRWRLAMERGDLRGAHEQAQVLTRELPQFAQSWLVLAQSLQAQGRFQEAISNYQQVLERQPQNAEALRGLIESCYALNNPQEAHRYITQAIRLLPNVGYFHELAANHEMLYGDPEKILAPRAQQVQSDPDNPAAWMTLGQSYFAAAKSKADKGDEAAVKNYMQKAIETFAQAREKWPDERQFVTYYSELSLLNGDYDSGLAALQQYAQREVAANSPEVALQLAEFYLRGGKVAEAETTLGDFLARVPTAAAVQIQLANLMAQQNKLDEALAVLEDNQDNNDVQQRRIELLIAANRIEQAEQIITAAMTHRSSPDLQVLLAFVYMNSNRVPQAIQQLDAVIAANPNNAVALHNRALIRLQQGESPEQAIKELTSVRDQLPGYMEARHLLAEAHQRNNDPEAAIRELESALRVQPAEKQVRLRLADLYAAANPPRWLDVERVLRDGLTIAQLSNDADLMHAQAIMWNNRGEPARALEPVRAALQIAPNNLNIIRTYCTALLASKNDKELLSETDRLLPADHGVWWAHVDRAAAQRGLNNTEQANKEFQAALNTPAAQQSQDVAAAIVRAIGDHLGLEPALAIVTARAQDDPSWRLVGIQLYMRNGDWRNARPLVDQVMLDYDRLNEPQQAAALRFAGDVYLSADPPELDKARKAYLKHLERHPNDVIVMNNLACLLVMPGLSFNPTEALTYSQRAYDQMRASGVTEPLLLDTHGWVLVNAGRVEEGIGILQSALDRQPFVDVLYHLGEAHLRLTPPRPREAERFLVQAQQMVVQRAETQHPVDPKMKQNIESKLDLARQLQQSEPAASVSQEPVAN